MVIEVVRGLGLGGAESLLVARLEHEQRNGTSRTTRVVNTYSAECHFKERVRAAHVRVDDLGTSSRWLSAVRLWRLAATFSSDEPVVVHSPWPAAVLKLRRALKLRGARLVEVAHSTSYVAPTMLLGKGLNRYADRCIAVSEEVAMAPTTSGFREKAVVLAGVDRDAMRRWIESTPHATTDYRLELGVPVTAPLVVTVGNLYRDKRHGLLVDAVSKLPDGVHVVIVGGGPEEELLTDRIAAAGVGGRVHLLGRQPDAWKWMAVADVVAHPSAREGLPIALTEARAIGVPVVAFDVGGVSTVLAGQSGGAVLAKDRIDAFGDAVARALRDAPSARAVYSQRASIPSEWDVSRHAEEFYVSVNR